MLRDLVLKPAPSADGGWRFTDLLGSGEGIATNVLSDRLRRLERRDLLRRAPDPLDRRRVIYRPTERAADLVPMLVEMVAWGARDDPRSAADPRFLEKLSRDRDGLIRSIQDDVRVAARDGA